MCVLRAQCVQELRPSTWGEPERQIQLSFYYQGLANFNHLPDQMNLDGTPTPNEDLAEEFAKMFEKKINDTLSTTGVDDNVYNGTRKINEHNKNFMTSSNVRSAILSLKLKNSEGYYTKGFFGN